MAMVASVVGLLGRNGQAPMLWLAGHGDEVLHYYKYAWIGFHGSVLTWLPCVRRMALRAGRAWTG